MSANHSHAEGDIRRHDRRRRILLAVAINVIVVIWQVVVGVISGSFALISDAIHNASDVASLIVALVGVLLSGRAMSDRHSYGLHRASILAAQFNAVFMILISTWLFVKSLSRLGDAVPSHGSLIIIVAAIAMVANFVAARILHDGTDDVNMRAATLHLLADAAASAIVVLAGILVLLRPTLTWTDPACAMVISVLIAWRALKLLRETTHILLESVPESIDLDTIRTQLLDLPNVIDVHDLHAWTISSDIFALSVHVVFGPTLTLEQSQRQTASIKDLLRENFNISHATIEPEQSTCEPSDATCLPAANHAAHNH